MHLDTVVVMQLGLWPWCAKELRKNTQGFANGRDSGAAFDDSQLPPHSPTPTPRPCPEKCLCAPTTGTKPLPNTATCLVIFALTHCAWFGAIWPSIAFVLVAHLSALATAVKLFLYPHRYKKKYGAIQNILLRSAITW